jgi:hypothetical protein
MTGAASEFIDAILRARVRSGTHAAANGGRAAANALPPGAPAKHHGGMQKLLALLLAASAASWSAFAQAPTSPDALVYVGDRLQAPANYREWIYLTSGLDMSYRPSQAPDHHMFGNVFVNPQAYRAFQATGSWPDKTAIVLEMRGAKNRGSINKAGLFQDADVMGIEVHVKDAARFPGQWAFFAFDDDKPARMIPTSEACYSCHATHAAVDTTFVQFYPTLLPLASAKATLSAAYLAEEAAR